MTSVAAAGRWWSEDLDVSERSALHSTGANDRRPDVLVVGGGIMGVAIAHAVEGAGLGSVVLVEGGQLGAGSTGGAAGLLTPEPHVGVDPDALVDLMRDSLERWRALDDEVPGGVGLVDLAWLGLFPTAEEAAARSPKGELLGPDEVGRLVPGLASPMHGLRVAGQARVNPLRAVARLAARLRQVATGVRVTGVTVQEARITTIETTAGRVSPGAVVFATGNPPEVDGLEIAIPADVVRGHILLTEPVPAVFGGTVDPLGTQLADGRLLVGGTLDRGATDPGVDHAIVQELVAALGRSCAALGGVRVSRAWCCFRPHHPDDLPTIDRVPGVDNAWFTSGHYRTGILLAPGAAAVIAEWLGAGVAPARALPFCSERFSSGEPKEDRATA